MGISLWHIHVSTNPASLCSAFPFFCRPEMHLTTHLSQIVQGENIEPSNGRKPCKLLNLHFVSFCNWPQPLAYHPWRARSCTRLQVALKPSLNRALQRSLRSLLRLRPGLSWKRCLVRSWETLLTRTRRLSRPRPRARSIFVLSMWTVRPMEGRSRYLISEADSVFISWWYIKSALDGEAENRSLVISSNMPGLLASSVEIRFSWRRRMALLVGTAQGLRRLSSDVAGVVEDGVGWDNEVELLGLRRAAIDPEVLWPLAPPRVRHAGRCGCSDCCCCCCCCCCRCSCCRLHSCIEGVGGAEASASEKDGLVEEKHR